LGFVAGGLIMSAAVMCKYPALQLVPLLAVVALHRRNWPIQILALLMPVLAVVGFQWLSRRVYGSDYVGVATSYAANQWVEHLKTILPQLLVGLAFVGGSALPAGLAILATSRPRWLIVWLVGMIALFVAVKLLPSLMPFNAGGESRRAALSVQFAILASIGVAIIFATLGSIVRQRPRSSLLLVLWIIGVFIFATMVNWTINVRSLLPLLPSAPINAAGHVVLTGLRLTPARILTLASWLVLSSAIAIAAATADVSMARASRRAAEIIHQRARGYPGTIWFCGHWGFQWYMEQNGARAFDPDQEIPAGGLVIIPSNNSNLLTFPQGMLRPRDLITLETFPWLSTQNAKTGAGFYSSLAGPLPFAFGPAAQEQFRVYTIVRGLAAPTTNQGSSP
jgi:hypothetical protein